MYDEGRRYDGYSDSFYPEFDAEEYDPEDYDSIEDMTKSIVTSIGYFTEKNSDAIILLHEIVDVDFYEIISAGRAKSKEIEAKKEAEKRRRQLLDTQKEQERKKQEDLKKLAELKAKYG